MLTVSSLSVDVTDLRLLDKVSFNLKLGESLCVVGESGAGKSTLLKAMLGIMPFSEGRIRFQSDDVDLDYKPGANYTGLPGVSWVMQNPLAALNPLQRVGDAVAESLYYQKLSQKEQAELVTSAFREVELSPELANRKPTELSLGQAQRVCIARALISRPKLIIFDEPLSALDAVVQKQVARVIDQIQARHQLSYLFVSHDLGFASAYADDILLLREGQVEAYQPADLFFTKPASEYGADLIEAAQILGTLETATIQQPQLMEAQA